MKYSWKALKSTSKKRLTQGPFRLKDDHGMLQPPTSDVIAFPKIIRNFLTENECQRILDFRHELDVAESKVSAEGKESTYRKSQVSWVFPYPETSWLFDHIEKAIKEANKAYKFDLFGFFQGAQIAAYGKDGHYDWHSDVGAGGSSHRKISISILLNKPEEYEGGQLEFMSVKGISSREQGTAIIFPSYLVHRVAPVISGTRYSLVSWISGPPFR